MTELEIPVDFKTTLAPRKRAKTKEEKEQRRIERILRNRKAAHASREKKRKHVEFLEKYVLELEKQGSLLKSLNSTLLDKHYNGGDDGVDKLVGRLCSLPDLEKMKIDHNIELDDQGFDFPRTPESYSASSPKAEYDAPQFGSRNNSVSSIPELTMSRISPLSSPENTTTNRFSLDIIDPTVKNPLFTDVFIKKEESEVGIPDFIKKEEDPSLQFPEQINPFEDFQLSTFDSSIGLDELRNPAAITFMMLISDCTEP